MTLNAVTDSESRTVLDTRRRREAINKKLFFMMVG
jgi:hypothetical protein